MNIDPGAAGGEGGVPVRLLHGQVSGRGRLLRDAREPREHRHQPSGGNLQ